MRNLLLVFICSGMLLWACNEPIAHIELRADSTKITRTYKSRATGGSIPGLNAEVIDYTLANPYQSKRQLFRDSTICMSWDQAGFPNAKRFITFFEHFQWDVMDRNKERIAGLISFPIPGYPSRADFIRDFDLIFGPEFVEQILHQNPMEIYRNKAGAMIGNDGQLWFQIRGGQYKIVRINP
jgi:hypothetical protein